MAIVGTRTFVMSRGCQSVLDTYDGRHNKMNDIQFRSFVDRMAADAVSRGLWVEAAPEPNDAPDDEVDDGGLNPSVGEVFEDPSTGEAFEDYSSERDRDI